MAASTPEKINSFLAQYKTPGLGTEAALTEISNVYHRFESAIYDAAHPDIWQNRSFLKDAIRQNVLANAKQPIRILDLGCGTGFVSSCILELQMPDKISSLTLFDISEDMVAMAAKKLDGANIPLHFLSGVESMAALQQEPFDLVVSNAVLHHIADLDNFCKMIHSLVKPGGFYIAGHEPNAAYYKNKLLQDAAARFRKFKKRQSRLSLKYWLFKLGLSKSVGAVPYLDIAQLSNAALLATNIIHQPIPPLYLPKLIDIHVPITDFNQQPWGEPGFDAAKFSQRFLPGFEVVETSTYSHIKDNLVQQFPKWKQLSASLQSDFPNDGADLLMVLRKQG